MPLIQSKGRNMGVIVKHGRTCCVVARGTRVLSYLVAQEPDFFDLLQLYFPKLYDIKLLVSSQNGFHGGLNKLAEDLKVQHLHLPWFLCGFCLACV